MDRLSLGVTIMVRQAIIIIFLLFLLTHSYATEINYFRSTELPPLRISFADLQKILDKSVSLMATANSKGSSQSWREEISLYRGDHRVTLSGHLLNAEGARIPETIDRFEYIARAENPPGAVSRIQMSFSNISRDFKVEGSSPDQVDAVFLSLKDDLLGISSTVGGFLFEYFLRLILSLGTIMYIWMTLYDWRILKKQPAVAPLVFSIVTLILVWALPLGEMFAGFSAVKGDASFMTRYGPQISFLSLVVSIAGIPISYWLSKTKTQKSK